MKMVGITKSWRVAGLALASAGIFLLGPVADAGACVGCRTAGDMVKNEESSTVRASVALSWSVLFMLGTIGALGSFMVVAMKRTIAQVEAERREP